MQESKISHTIIFACIIIAEIILLGGNVEVGIGEWTAVIVAIIGVAGGIWAQIIQFKKDAQRIDSVNSTASSVKEDTTEIRPLVAKMDTKTDKIK